jgi:hypothetical protein
MHTATHAYVSLALVWLVLPVVVSGMGLSPLSSESPQSFAGGRAFVMSEAQKKASERGAVSPFPLLFYLCHQREWRRRIRHRREELRRGLEAGRGRLRRRVALLQGDDGLDAEALERLTDAHGAHSGGAAAGEGEHVRRAAALHVQVDAPHDRAERVYNGRGGRARGVAAEDRSLLAVPCRRSERAKNE